MMQRPYYPPQQNRPPKLPPMPPHRPPVTDHGPQPYVANIPQASRENPNYRTAYWTGENLQLTLMTILPQSEIGLEMHPDTDQYIRVEEGQGLVATGSRKDRLDIRRPMRQGDAVFVPAGTWHNIKNTGATALRLSSVYAPPQHPRGTVHKTKEDAEEA